MIFLYLYLKSDEKVTSVLVDLFRIFYPKLCVGCNHILSKNEQILCTFCRHDLPLTHYTNYTNNKIASIFKGRIPIENAYALLFFRKEGITKKLIHNLKYRGNEEIGVFFGDWLGELLKSTPHYSNIDYIIPVPLHKKKLQTRGYNQVSKFGHQLGHHLKKPLLKNLLLRTNSATTQTFKSRLERFNNTQTTFSLNTTSNTLPLKNKHFLLIDDVITTGATLEACAREIQKIEGAKISILTMAYTE